MVAVLGLTAGRTDEQKKDDSTATERKAEAKDEKKSGDKEVAVIKTSEGEIL
jgi:hypothetical protein